MSPSPKSLFYLYAIYTIPNTIVKIAKTIANITVHLFCFPSFVLLLFFSKKLLVDEPVIVEDKPESSFDCTNANIINANCYYKIYNNQYPFCYFHVYIIPFSELKKASKFLLTFTLKLYFAILTYIF